MTPEDIVYQTFLSKYPKYQNKNGKMSLDWANYLNRRAHQFQSDWIDYIKDYYIDPKYFSIFPCFPGIESCPCESNAQDKISNARHNFMRCYNWFEANKKKLQNHQHIVKRPRETVTWVPITIQTRSYIRDINC